MSPQRPYVDGLVIGLWHYHRQAVNFATAGPRGRKSGYWEHVFEGGHWNPHVLLYFLATMKQATMTHGSCCVISPQPLQQGNQGMVHGVIGELKLSSE